jgi:CDGSH-type Zn-finger protein
VDVNAADPDEIAETVMRCPTGALHFVRLDGGSREPVPEETLITERPNGPLYVRGRLKVRRQDGSVREETRVALCRCGQSGNKPFCDGTHYRIGFCTTFCGAVPGE